MKTEFTPIGKKVNDLVIKIESINLRTPDKLKELKKILQEYQSIREEEIEPVKQHTFTSSDIIQIIDSYLNRKRLGKKTENNIFKEWKDVALIRLRNTQSHFRK